MIKLNQPQPGFAQGLENNSQSQFSSQFQSNQDFNKGFPNQPAFDQTQPLNNQLNQTPKGLFQIPERYLQLIPLLPFALEMLTGQKVPPVGVMADILSEVRQVQFNLQQLQASQQQLLNSQNQLWNQLKSLENSASSQLNSLSQQVINTSNSFKMLATETRKSFEINSQPKVDEPERNAIEYN